MTTGDRIKRKRIDLGLSVDEVAEALGKNRATVYRYEGNEIENMPITVLEPIATILHTTPAYLMGWEDDPDQKFEPTPVTEDGLSEKDSELVRMLTELTPTEVDRVRDFVAGLLAAREASPSPQD